MNLIDGVLHDLETHIALRDAFISIMKGETMTSDVAYTRYDIVSYDTDYVEVHFETNDDRDYGVPTEHSSDTLVYKGENAVAKALKHTGTSRQGIGHRVYVTLDGETI